MAAANVTVGLSVQWTPPGATLNSGNASAQVQASYNAQNVGQIDIPSTATPAQVISIPFGSISVAKVFVIRSMLSGEVGVRLNGAVANTFSIPAGGEFVYAAALVAADEPITEADLVVIAAPSATEQVNFYVFGD